MDRMNISGNTGDMGIAGFVKPASVARTGGDEAETKVTKAASEKEALGVDSEINIGATASAESSISSSREAAGMVARSADSIIRKADESVLAQANQLPKDVESLLKFAS